MSGDIPDPILLGRFLAAVQAWDIKRELAKLDAEKLKANGDQPCEPAEEEEPEQAAA